MRALTTVPQHSDASHLSADGHGAAAAVLRVLLVKQHDEAPVTYTQRLRLVVRQLGRVRRTFGAHHLHVTEHVRQTVGNRFRWNYPITH